MNENLKNPIIEWRTIKNREFLYFTFNGTLTQKSAQTAIEEWKNIFNSRKGEKIIIIWQCLEMKGYEPMARSLWQNAIKELKSQINAIWLITNSGIIKAGAKIMSLFTSYEIKVVKSDEEIEI